MICKYIIKALKGQNHQHGATPCDWRTEPTFGRGCTSSGDIMAGLTCRDIRYEVQPRTNKGATDVALANAPSGLKFACVPVSSGVARC